MIEIFEVGDSRQFTFVSSVAPDAAPIFKVIGVGASVIASITAITDVLVFVASPGITTIVVNTAFGIARDSLFVRNHF